MAMNITFISQYPDSGFLLLHQVMMTPIHQDSHPEMDFKTILIESIVRIVSMIPLAEFDDLEELGKLIQFSDVIFRRSSTVIAWKTLTHKLRITTDYGH